MGRCARIEPRGNVDRARRSWRTGRLHRRARFINVLRGRDSFIRVVPPRTCLWKRDTTDCISRINIGSAIDIARWSRTLVSDALFDSYSSDRDTIVVHLYLNDNNNNGTCEMGLRKKFFSSFPANKDVRRKKDKILGRWNYTSFFAFNDFYVSLSPPSLFVRKIGRTVYSDQRDVVRGSGAITGALSVPSPLQRDTL